MIVTRTPFRISFFGGGTDYPDWFRANGGAVVSATIDKYCWITCRELPPFFEHRSRIIYSLIENVKTLEEIKHPSARECLRYMGIEKGVEVHHDGDLPARTGLGSSSSFTVGLLHALHQLQGRTVSRRELALAAIKVEQEYIRENVGCQDQVAAAFGGLNSITFMPDSTFVVKPLAIKSQRLEALEERLMLFYTGVSRYASELLGEQIKNIPKKQKELENMRAMVERGMQLMCGTTDLGEFGQMLHEAWSIKKTLSSRVSNTQIDSMYEDARSAGAIGGKVLGAGGGGFVLFYVEPKDQQAVRERLRNYLNVPFKFEFQGSEVVYSQSQAGVDGKR